jgi:hypothetical protein
MSSVKRREFLAQFSCSVGLSLLPFAVPSRAAGFANAKTAPCWLDVTAPFVIEDPALGIRSEIILTSDTFSGASGHADGADVTDYEIYL